MGRRGLSSKTARGMSQESTPRAPKNPRTSVARPAEEEEPVLSGRMVIAVAFALAMSVIPVSGLGQYITKTTPETAARALWRVGQSANIHLTVVTSDYNHLACAMPEKLGEYHCEFKNEREKYPLREQDAVDDNKANVLQPYRTTDRNLILAPGLWAQPEVAMRLHNEPPLVSSEKSLARFVVACDVKFLAEWKDTMVRWKQRERWSNQGAAMVTEFQNCKILQEE